MRYRIRSAALFLLISSLFLPLSGFAGQAKNIILMIGDGMGPGQFAAAWLYSNKILNKELRMVEVMKGGRTAFLANGAADAIVTESAAAASQIATGMMMTTGTISMAADGKTPVKTILEIAKDRGMATGLVTTSGITDATPAAFAAHVAHRSDETAVADQELRAGVEVLMGGRKQFFLSEVAAGKRKDGRNLLDEARAAGYVVIDTADELKRVEGGKVLGLFNMGNMAYEIDRGATAEPSLAEMTTKTLQILSRNPKGFFAMIEGGRIDHAAHQNDAAGTIRDTLAFDEAVGVGLDFQRKNPDTLVIVTADHETGGMAIIGNSVDLAAIRKVQASFEVVADALGMNPTPEKVREVVKRYLAVEITDDEAKMVTCDPIWKLGPHNYAYPMMHSLAFVLRPYLGVGWVSQTHIASLLLAFGSGPGSEALVGFRHNTELFQIMKNALEERK
jgi:alkaline phosphatase